MCLYEGVSITVIQYSPSYKAIPFIRSDFRSNEIAIYGTNTTKLTPSRVATPLIRSLYPCRRSSLIRGGLLYLYSYHLLYLSLVAQCPHH